MSAVSQYINALGITRTHTIDGISLTVRADKETDLQSVQIILLT